MQGKKKWYRLDNAATIFPGQNTSRWSNVFRFSVMLTEKVDPAVLEQALKAVLPRFPCYDVSIRRGFFWYYLEENPNDAPPVQPDITNPCHRVKYSENKGFLFRVYYYENRISVDMFHALTDGNGAAVFTCTLAAEYLRLCGYDIPVGGKVLDVTEPAKLEEIVDPFKKCGKSDAKIPRIAPKVYHNVGTKLPAHMVNITRGIMPLEQIHSLAKSYDATITEFVGALLLFVHYEKQKNEEEKQKYIALQVPASLHKIFGVETLRNFSLIHKVGIDPLMGDYTFEEVLRHFSLYLRDVNNEKTLRAMASSNLRLAQSPLMRILPLFIKDIAIAITFNFFGGEQTNSGLFSNLGRVDLPQEMQKYVDCVEFMAGPGRLNGTRVATCGYKDKFIIDFTNSYQESDIERAFFTSLVKMGVKVKIESNRR